MCFDGRLADKIKKMLLIYPKWMIPFLHNVQHITNAMFRLHAQCVRLCVAIYTEVPCVWAGYTHSVYVYVLRYIQKHSVCGQVT
jgi:hypothetical protein